MSAHEIRSLTLDTWDALAALIEKHNGVWGGCWDSYFHPDDAGEGKKALGHRAFKRQMVELGIAHAALVFDGEQVIAWCEYGSPAELPGIYHRKERDAAAIALPDYRITCFFVDRDHRRSGIAAEALAGALAQIAEAGGGVVESYPQDLASYAKNGAPVEKISASFLHNATRPMFARAGFEYLRPLGLHKSVMRLTVAAR